ncbi:MAG: ECF transporter S component [Candidatus Dormibacteraeota bacterium]|nr:ECF transporter S component [Candidatus Dormibacteraeota bacterium]MBV9525451.1 ECF transporter S component [Candidatus Dormibacteraeota bacterium]
MILAAISAAGLLLFFWPLFASAAPPQTFSFAIALGVVAVLAFIELATRRLDARRFALLAAIAALDAALRLVLVVGLGGFSPIFFLILAAGYVYGPSFGFLCGATSLLTSAVATGGIGPWLPYQVIACGWVGMAAGLAGLRRTGIPRRRDVIALALVGLVTGYVFGALLDVWDWTTFYRAAPSFGWLPGLSLADALSRFGRFYLATSAVYDSFRAAGNVLMIAVLGAPVLAALARLRSRFHVVVLTADQPPLTT